VTVPIGYLVSVAIVALGTILALAPLRRPRPLATLSFLFSVVFNELPLIALIWLVASTLLALRQGDLNSPGGWVALGLAVLTTAGLAIVLRRGLLAGPAVDQALRGSLGPGWRDRVQRQRQLIRALFAPFALWRRDVERIANVSYGGAERAHRLDVYRHRSRRAGRPVLIHFHGGHFQMGGKGREARPLFHRLAARGWLCVSANYRLGEAGRFPGSLIDAKQAIAWVRHHAAGYGGDASVLVVAGSSAGAHLAAMAALTPNDPAFQPGFERADTAVSAAVCLYGYYGSRTSTGPRPSSPQAYVRPDAPPFLVLHGDLDTVVPVEAGARFAETLRCASSNPVIYVQLPGAQHAFDVFNSVRFAQALDAVEAFTAWVCSKSGEAATRIGRRR
jgi:acetyl esterase/lipase